MNKPKIAGMSINSRNEMVVVYECEVCGDRVITLPCVCKCEREAINRHHREEIERGII